MNKLFYERFCFCEVFQGKMFLLPCIIFKNLLNLNPEFWSKSRSSFQR